MIQVYICEDEKIQLEFWKRIIENYIKSTNVMGKIVSARQNPQKILEDIEQEKCVNVQKLFFIDIQMPGYDMDGLDLAKKLRKKSNDYYLVFITAKDNLAYKVFEYQLDVLDFIVKTMLSGCADVFSKTYSPSPLSDVILQLFNFGFSVSIIWNNSSTSNALVARSFCT